MPKVPYPYEVNGKLQLVSGNGSLTPICSLSNSSLMPSLTVVVSNFKWKIEQICVASSEYLNFVNKMEIWTALHCAIWFLYHRCFFRLLQLLYNCFMLPLEFRFSCDKNDMIVISSKFGQTYPMLKKMFGYL